MTLDKAERQMPLKTEAGVHAGCFRLAKRTQGIPDMLLIGLGETLGFSELKLSSPQNLG
jgi:hypothetical protein